ncbi:MAG: hypothetical protein WBX09_20025 [Terracidiphilus sp.]
MREDADLCFAADTIPPAASALDRAIEPRQIAARQAAAAPQSLLHPSHQIDPRKSGVAVSPTAHTDGRTSLWKGLKPAIEYPYLFRAEIGAGASHCGLDFLGPLLCAALYFELAFEPVVTLLAAAPCEGLNLMAEFELAPCEGLNLTAGLVPLVCEGLNLTAGLEPLFCDGLNLSDEFELAPCEGLNLTAGLEPLFCDGLNLSAEFGLALCEGLDLI